MTQYRVSCLGIADSAVRMRGTAKGLIGSMATKTTTAKIKLQYLELEEATSALVGFHAAPSSWLNWNLEIYIWSCYLFLTDFNSSI